MVALAIKIFDVAVDVLLASMELPVQTALRIRNRSDVIYDRLPVHRFSPEKRLHSNVKLRSGFDEYFHLPVNSS